MLNKQVVKIVEYILGVYESTDSSSSVASPPPTWNYLEKDYPYYHVMIRNTYLLFNNFIF